MDVLGLELVLLLSSFAGGVGDLGVGSPLGGGEGASGIAVKAKHVLELEGDVSAVEPEALVAVLVVVR